MFETTIRYLGALLSSYELGGQKDHTLVEKARQVADKMSVAWVGVGSFDPLRITSDIDNPFRIM